MPELVYTYEVDGIDEIEGTFDSIAEAFEGLPGDDGGERAYADEQETKLRAVGSIVKEVLDDAARAELSTAAYINRTGELAASTYAGDIETDGNNVKVDFGARAEHASYVVKKGFSRLPDIADAAADEIDQRLADLAGS